MGQKDVNFEKEHGGSSFLGCVHQHDVKLPEMFDCCTFLTLVAVFCGLRVHVDVCQIVAGELLCN